MYRRFNLLVILISLVTFFSIGITAPVYAGDYHFKWRLAQTMPADSDHHRRCVAFAEEVKAKTDGRIEIKVYSGSVLGDWVNINEYVMRGDVDMALLPLAPTYDPRLNIGYYMPSVVSG